MTFQEDIFILPSKRNTGNVSVLHFLFFAFHCIYLYIFENGSLEMAAYLKQTT